MHDEHPHPLLAQLPLTVSPFLSLPTATPLPYSYKQLPSTLPPSVLSPPNQTSADPQQHPQMSPQPQPPQPAAYVVSQSGTTAMPDSILQSCRALQAHLSQLESDARAKIQEWEDRRIAAELAEKRRVAPGWLDGHVKLLVPENVSARQGQAEVGAQGDRLSHERRTSVGIKGLIERRDGVPDPREGEELDRVFGGLDIK
ncbi:hypothetical protein K469DRAFT_718855 [Zopfia rhizophila CBS 207.26]|uniref:Uncharacterized protein n=1 Tax=Zopfia rhizophila CBS 207.26 TaxID=1314779 RepID=A0A6A6EM55_9PEZI|nr:hypothetical protein K469DRAFT_718855 [Zopfia rhizophila CBS 207.26]